MKFHYDDGARVPYAMSWNGHPVYLFYDQIGSLRVIADEQGNVIKEIRFDSFGRILEDSNPAMMVPLGFAGGLHDRDVGWVRFGYRDYDPLTARFTAKDPLGYAGGDNDLYGYCLDDPVNMIDPLGLESFWNGPGGRIVQEGLETGIECAIPGVAYGASLGPGGAAAYGAGSFMACGAAGMLKGTMKKALFGGEEDELPETIDHRRETPAPTWKR